LAESEKRFLVAKNPLLRVAPFEFDDWRSPVANSVGICEDCGALRVVFGEPPRDLQHIYARNHLAGFSALELVVPQADLPLCRATALDLPRQLLRPKSERGLQLKLNGRLLEPETRHLTDIEQERQIAITKATDAINRRGDLTEDERKRLIEDAKAPLSADCERQRNEFLMNAMRAVAGYVREEAAACESEFRAVTSLINQGAGTAGGIGRAVGITTRLSPFLFGQSTLEGFLPGQFNINLDVAKLANENDIACSIAYANPTSLMSFKFDDETLSLKTTYQITNIPENAKANPFAAFAITFHDGAQWFDVTPLRVDCRHIASLPLNNAPEQ
jgi:hypothetical protein